MLNSNITTRPITHDDLKQVVEILKNGFEGFFLTLLGPWFLTVFYSAVIEDPTGITLLAFDDRGVYGFVVGTSKPSKFYRRLIINRILDLLTATLPSIIKNPRILPHRLRGFLLPSDSARPDGWRTLMSIAVDKEGQNLGIGHLLLE